MGLEGQGRIKQVIEQNSTRDVVAILGAVEAENLRMTAETLMNGDPSYAGPLAGLALGVPSFHILEQEIASQVERSVYERELALTAMTVGVEELVEPLRSLRGDSRERPPEP